MEIDINLNDISCPMDTVLNAQNKRIIYCKMCGNYLDEWDTQHTVDYCLENLQKRIRTLEERMGIK